MDVRRFHSSIGCLAASHCVLCLCLAAVLCKQRFSGLWLGGRQPRGMQGCGPVRAFESELLLVWMLTGAANMPLGCAWRVRKSQAAWASCGQQPSSAPQHAEGCTELNEWHGHADFVRVGLGSVRLNRRPCTGGSNSSGVGAPGGHPGHRASSNCGLRWGRARQHLRGELRGHAEVGGGQRVHWNGAAIVNDGRAAQGSPVRRTLVSHRVVQRQPHSAPNTEQQVYC